MTEDFPQQGSGNETQEAIEAAEKPWVRPSFDRGVRISASVVRHPPHDLPRRRAESDQSRRFIPQVADAIVPGARRVGAERRREPVRPRRRQLRRGRHREAVGSHAGSGCGGEDGTERVGRVGRDVGRVFQAGDRRR